MISPQDFIQQWGSDDLIRYNPICVEALTIPSASKRFLTEAGLPRMLYPADFMTFRAFPDLPLLGETFGHNYAIPAQYRMYRVLSVVGFEDWAPTENISVFFCLDEQEGGRVVDVDKGRISHFSNSSVVQFAEFLLVIKEYHRWLRQRVLEDDQHGIPFRCYEVDEMGEDVRQKLRQIDPDAFAVSEGEDYSAWESCLLETEMATGCAP